MRIFLIVGLIIVYILLPVASAEIQYKIIPSDPVIGDTVTIKGTEAYPDNFIYLSIIFETDVKVKNSLFQYTISGISIPPENNNFKLTARPVDELSIYAKPEWLPIGGLTYKGEINNNIGSISHGHIIVPAKYNIKINGKSHDTKVNLKITTTARLQSDSKGDFSYQYPTAGLPSGEYSIEISGKEKEMELKSTSIQRSTITLTESSASESSPTQDASGIVQTSTISSEYPEISETIHEIPTEESVTSEATPEMTTSSEKTVTNNPATSSAVPEKESILQKILDYLKFW